MTERDKKLIEEAKHLIWEQIDEDAADTEEARQILHEMYIRGYHYDEWRCGMG